MIRHEGILEHCNPVRKGTEDVKTQMGFPSFVAR